MFEPGTVVGGRYRLIREVGQGGMATVWEAEHLTLGSPVAIKFLASSAGPRQTQLIERFMREARVAASVRHRNVIEITDFGISDDGRAPYMVMEMLQGEALADRLEREGHLHVGTAVQVVWLSLRGLAAVHDAGIVHRDLKPENIFLVDDPDGAYPKLLDFGVSRRVADTDITQEGILVGTPDYMSPEQARGLRDINLRTDIYSMGVILYEALAGQLPFQSENAGDLLMMITKEAAPPLSSHRPGINPAICEVVERAMHKDRDERYQEAREMRWALAEAAAEYGLSSERESGVSRISEFPNTGSGLTPRLPRDSSISEPSVVSRETDTLQMSVDEHAFGHEPLGGPPSAAPAGRRSTARLVVLFALLAAAVGATLAMTVPDSPLQYFGGAEADPRAVAVPWEPETPAMPIAELEDDTEAPPEVRVALYDLPDGSVARVEDVSVDADEVWLPEQSEGYRVEVLASGTALWSVLHPGNVDGEYEVWPMTEAELSEARAQRADAERVRPRGHGGGPRRRR